MSAKSGGNKKVSSPSTQGYWKRAKMGNFSETHRQRRIDRHRRRMGLNIAQISKAIAVHTMPKIKETKSQEYVVFTGLVPEHRWLDRHGHVMSYPKFEINHGVIVDVHQQPRPKELY
jgi:hypothetical protein